MALNSKTQDHKAYLFWAGDYNHQEAVIGTRLADVLSIIINPTNKECNLYGEILVEDDEGRVSYIFNWDNDGPVSISSDSEDRSLELWQSNRAIFASKYFTMDFKLREGDSEFLYGSFCWDAGIEDDYDKPVVKTIYGKLGSATIKYIVHSLASQVHIGVSLVTSKSASLNVNGTISAGYKNLHDSNSLTEVKLCDMNSFEMVEGDIFPLTKTVIAMPFYHPLIIKVELQNKDGHAVLWNGQVEYSTAEVRQSVVKDIEGECGSVRVRVYEVNYGTDHYQAIEEEKKMMYHYGVIPRCYWASDDDDSVDEANDDSVDDPNDDSVAMCT